MPLILFAKFDPLLTLVNLIILNRRNDNGFIEFMKKEISILDFIAKCDNAIDDLGLLVKKEELRLQQFHVLYIVIYF